MSEIRKRLEGIGLSQYAEMFATMMPLRAGAAVGQIAIQRQESGPIY
jgi:hypothetical protein